MRVIGGTFGGRRLRPVEGHRTRPTSDRVREALLSRIEARYGLTNSVILDLFAGTGALAIEALSRGAARAVCIEVERRAIETLRGNVRDFALEPRVRVISDDYRRVLARLAGERTASAAGGASGSTPAPPDVRKATSRRRFDGVFVDPPYGKGLAIAALEALAAFGLVLDGGWVSVEVGRREETPEIVHAAGGSLRRVREDVYGDTKLALYESSRPLADSPIPAHAGTPSAEVHR